MKGRIITAFILALVTQGVQAISLKKNRKLRAAAPLSATAIKNVSRYRVRSIPGAGALLKEEDSEEQQLSLLD